jgi:hypothetical protein
MMNVERHLFFLYSAFALEGLSMRSMKFAGMSLAVAAFCWASLPAGAAGLTSSSVAPASAAISQPDFSAAAFGPSNDFTDNAGPPGQTFTPASSLTMTGLTVKGFANTSASFGGTVNTGSWTLTISRVDPGNILTRLDQETANPSAVTDGSAYLTFALDNPVSLNAGTTYAYDIFSSIGYFGFAKSSTDVYAGGVAMQHGGTSRTSADGVAFTNAQAVDRTFFVQGTVPEPASVSILAISALGLLARRTRRS